MSEENNKTGADLANAAKDFAHAEEQLQRMIEDLIKVQSREKNLRSAVEALEEVKAALLSASLRFGELSSKSQSAIDEIGRLISVIQSSEIGKVVEELEKSQEQFSNYEKSIDKKLQDLSSQNSNEGNEVKRALESAETRQTKLIEGSSETFKLLIDKHENSTIMKLQELSSQNSNQGNKIEKAIATAETKLSKLIEDNSESINTKLKTLDEKLNSSFTKILASVWAVGLLLAFFIATPK